MEVMNNFQRVHFVGVGGIGMSALARYLNHIGKTVSGYDRSESALTNQLVQEGIDIWYHPQPKRITEAIDIVVYTPAVNMDHLELKAAEELQLNIVKRAEFLGVIAEGYKVIAVAGTHGKTTTSTILAEMLSDSEIDPLIILGGIYKKWNSNFRMGHGEFLLTEADEYDRSFLSLSPKISIINSLDADHLDIYDSAENMIEGYEEFIYGHSEDSVVIIYQPAFHLLSKKAKSHCRYLTFGESEDCDYCLKDINVDDGRMKMTWSFGGNNFKQQIPLPGRHNALNTLAALAVINELNLDHEETGNNLSHFGGIARRFETRWDKDGVVIIDDYAHHPTEIRAAMNTARELFPDKRLTVVFQAHLYTRTRDFMNEFSEELSKADRFYSCELYPARELPIEGVSGKVLFDKVKVDFKVFGRLEELPKLIKHEHNDVILVLGAGSINLLIDNLIEVFEAE